MKNALIDSKRLFDEFDMISEADVAKLFGIDRKTLKNRPFTKQPAYTKVGNRRLYHKKSVAEFLAANIRGEVPLRRDKPRLRKRGEQRPTA